VWIRGATNHPNDEENDKWGKDSSSNSPIQVAELMHLSSRCGVCMDITAQNGTKQIAGAYWLGRRHRHGLAPLAKSCKTSRDNRTQTGTIGSNAGETVAKRLRKLRTAVVFARLLTGCPGFDPRAAHQQLATIPQSLKRRPAAPRLQMVAPDHPADRGRHGSRLAPDDLVVNKKDDMSVRGFLVGGAHDGLRLRHCCKRSATTTSSIMQLSEARAR
jgi:hypothetical protein